MENDLTRMMDELRRHNATQRGEVAAETPWDGVMPEEGFVSGTTTPKVAAPTTASEQILGVNLGKRTIETSSGPLPLDDDGAKEVARICIDALRRHYERTIERIAQGYGLWPNAVSSQAAQEGVTNASASRFLDGSIAPPVGTKRTRGGKRKEG